MVETVTENPSLKPKKTKKKKKGKKDVGEKREGIENGGDATSAAPDLADANSEKGAARPNKQIVDLFWLISSEDTKVCSIHLSWDMKFRIKSF